VRQQIIARTLLLAGATLAALGIPGPAISGVLDAAPAYSPPPEYDWTGFYVGLNGGGSWGRANWESDPDVAAGTVTRSSGLVGGTLGYNMQNLGPFVVGGEFDFNWRRFDFTIPAATCGPTCELDSNWFSTARLRFGYQIDRFLPYVTGGLSMADFTAYGFGQPNGTNKSVSFNFTAGAGVEFVLTGPLTGKVEYLFVNHSLINCIVECNGPVNISPNENIFRVGLNYRLWQR
jgi:outer membrane immunogenic protein